MKYSKTYTDYIVSTAKKLISIPSPTGYTKNATEFIYQELSSLCYSPVITNRGNLICDLGGEGKPIILAGHIDTLGGMVRSVKPNDRLRMTRVGGLALGSAEAENCTIFTRDGHIYSGTLQMNEPSSHVAGTKLSEEKRTEETMEIVIDELTHSAKSTKALGIDTGDFIAFDPRFTEVPSGFIKSRFLDDKAGSSVLIALARYISENRLSLSRKTYLLFTCHEEVGTGAASGLPDAEEFISVDMGCVGGDLSCDETMVSICVKDGGGPYDYGIVSRMIEVAKRNELNYACDVYPFYGSDAGAAVRAGYHLRHACIGPGIYASHGYERGHRDGFANTLKLIIGYLFD